jgi:hypothetical protein
MRGKSRAHYEQDFLNGGAPIRSLIGPSLAWRMIWPTSERTLRRQTPQTEAGDSYLA